MPWYKSGTVSVVLNSNAVIGAGTAFIANSRVGDAFRGPDGGWYEVTNIASDTAMSISPNYQGATNAAGVYALAPMQGYIKDSADALRALVNQYGAKLAALGTTGNYDVLPITKGGTGGTDQASARNGLGLGTAATAPLVTSSTDTTGGRALTVGYCGLGNMDNAPFAGINLAPDNYRTGGQFIGQFVVNGVALTGYLTVLSGSNNTTCGQMFVDASTGATYVRVKNGGVWQATWSPVLRGGATMSSEGTTLKSGNCPDIATISSSGNGGKVQLRISNDSNSYASSVISFYRAGSFEGFFGLDTDNVFKIGGGTFGNNSYKVYHAGNTTRAADGTLKAI